MNKIIMCITLVVCALLTNGQQKANYKLAERYKKHEIVGVSGNSMAIYPEFLMIPIAFGILSRIVMEKDIITWIRQRN